MSLRCFSLLALFLNTALLPALFSDVRGQTVGDQVDLLSEAITLENKREYANAFILYLKHEEAHRISANALKGLSRTAKRADKMDRYRELLRTRFYEYPADRLVAKLYVGSLYNSGRRDEALLSGGECLRRWPSAVEVHRNVGTMYRSNKMLGEAVEVFEGGREHLGKKNLYSREMAELHFQQGNYEDSIQEYLLFLEDHVKSVSFVERRLLDIARAMGDTTLIVEKVRKTESLNRCGWPQPLLIDLEIAAGFYDNALTSIVTCSEGRDPNKLLQELLRLARLANRSGRYEVARSALDEAINSCSGTRPEVRIQLASELSKMGFEEDARPLFEALVEEDLSSGNRIECYESLGDLYLNVLGQPGEAISWYRKLAGEGVAPEHTANLSMKVAEAMVASRRLEEGLAELLALEASPVKGSLNDRITFEVGNIYFYTGQLEEAVRYYRKLVDTAPSFEATSEAIDVLRLEKSYGEQDKEALKMLGRARYAERLGDRMAARKNYAGAVSIAVDPGFRDEIEFMLASALARWGSTGEALSLYEKVAEHGEEDFLAARALMEVGRIHYGVLGDAEAARVVFEKLILQYSSVIETEEARHLLAEIEGRL